MLQILVSSILFASIPNLSSVESSTLSALRQSETKRLTYFEKKSDVLQKIIFSDKYAFQYRWMAFATLVKLRADQAVFEKALLSHEWFLRDVALKASLEYFPKKAIEWNRRALNDSALVVRTTAVKNLKKLQDTKSIDALWDELYAQRNFRKTQGLWIRKHILDTIVSLLPEEKKKDETWQTRFHQILKTEDESLQPYVLAALKQNFPLGPSFVKDEPISIQRKKWLAWLSKNQL